MSPRRDSQPHLAMGIAVAVVTVFAVCGARAEEDSVEEQPSEIGAVAWLQTTKLDAKLAGRLLVEEHNCIACHRTDAPEGGESALHNALQKASKTSPRLAGIGSRINPHYLQSFIQNPHGMKPGTPMPDVMGHLPAKERSLAAKAITHFLVSQDRGRGFGLNAIDTVAAEQGRELFHTIGCVACHSPRNESGEELLTASSVPLGELATKYNTRTLADFLRAPHRTRPSGRMPDMKLGGREPEQLAHYLLRNTVVPGNLRYTLIKGRVWEGLDINVTKDRSGLVEDFSLARIRQVSQNSAVVYEGFVDIKTPGEYTFYLEWNGGELWMDDAKVVELAPSGRRGVKKSQGRASLSKGFHKIKLIYIHAGRNPSFRFEMEGPEFQRQAIPATQLSISPTPIEPYRPYPVDDELAAQGKLHFAELGCASCHNDVKVTPRPQLSFAKLNAARGCLSGESGRWPKFGFSPKQQTHIAAALTELKGQLDTTLPAADKTVHLSHAETINKSLVQFNCVSCHNREELGGVSIERNPYFVGSRKELGDQGRIPPQLTHVGAKLQKEWIRQVMINGQEQRVYLETRMPKFGEANVGHLVDTFEKVDQLEPVKFEKINNVPEYKKAGHQLIGTTGFSCVACHDFNGQRAGGPGALDIIQSTQRLKKDYFYHYLLNPIRFNRRTIMPAAWPGGHAFKKDILGGDTKKQIESVWVYLADGTRAKNPIGLARTSPEIRVTDEAVIARGRGSAGYRGIAVGYPERISLAYDSQEMNLRMLWRGEFVTTSPGRFNVRSRDQITFPPGIPFHKLESLDTNWPYKRKTDYLFPQDHGYQFRGYYLGEKKRPTFMYRYGKIQVEEAFIDLLDDEKRAYFRRRFTFQSPTDAPKPLAKFYFRAASAKKIEPVTATKTVKTFKADRLSVTIRGPQEGVIREGEPNELLIPLELPAGKSTLILDYKW